MLGRCKTCEALQRQIDYLQKIIDRLLVKQGSTPIIEKPLEEKEEPSEADKILEKGGIIYGE